MNSLTIIVGIILLGIAIISILSAFNIYRLFKQTKEITLFHFGVIFTLISLSFSTGSIGIFFELDQINHWVFDLNLLFFTLTFISIGMIFKSLNQNSHELLSDYILLLLMLSPSFALALLMGGPFIPAIALFSQIVPLLSAIYIEHRLASQMDFALKLIENQNDIQVINSLKKIFQLSYVIHGIGAIAMIIFGLYFITGQTSDIEQIWIDEFTLFDYGYFIALLGLLILFIRIFSEIINIRNNITDISMDDIMNAIQN